MKCLSLVYAEVRGETKWTRDIMGKELTNGTVCDIVSSVCLVVTATKVLKAANFVDGDSC